MQLPRADAYKLYLLLSAVQAIALTTVFTINLVYHVQQVGLNPLQLVLVGTVLELTAFLCEVPTGVVADVYSRRLSVIIGFLLLGIGFLIEGALPLFEALLLAQVVTGLGYTFLSGARSAWLVDEIGTERAGAAFLRASQVSQLASFAALFLSVALASISLQLAILCGGLLLLALAAFLALCMPELGFQARPASERETWQQLISTFRAGAAQVRSSRILLLIILATIFHGAFSEGFDRLSVAHILQNTALPPLGQLNDIVWFGIISAVSMPLSLAATEWLHRNLDISQGKALARALLLVYMLMFASVLLFALSESFELVLLGLWLTQTARALRNPLLEAWISQVAPSQLRATVLSIQGQADAFGQIAGGPIVGAVALFSTVRAALTLSALLLTPILPILRRSLRSLA